MKEEKELKEIVIRQNSGIVFPKNEGVNGDILILGNFKGICGEVTWHGIGNSSFEDNNFYNFESTFVTNISVLMDTLNAGNRIFIVGSKETISYFRNLLYTIADTFMFDMPAKKRKKMFNKQVWAIDTTELYERTFVKYNSTSEYRKEAADKAIHDIVTNKIFERIKHMKFDYIIQNPPYNGSLHLDFLAKGLDLLSDKGKMVIIEPCTWLIQLKENGRYTRETSLTVSVKNKINGHVESVGIENFDKEFGIENTVPFSTTVIDMSKKFDTIKFTCFGVTEEVKTIYDCNLIGEYRLIKSIFDKARTVETISSHVTNKQDNNDETYYVQISDIICPVAAIYHQRPGFALSDSTYFKTARGEFFQSFVSPAIHPSRNEVTNVIPKKAARGGSTTGKVKLTNKPANCVFGTKEEMENYKHYVTTNSLPLFLNICLSIDQHNNSVDYIPWLVDKQYTDEEINKMFGFTEEEIALIDRTIKKYERNSPWFKRYMCGPDSVSDEEVNNFIKSL